MKRHIALFLIVLMAVSVISATGVVSAAKSKTPAPVSPVGGALSTSGSVTFEWKPAPGAASYTIVLTKKDASGTYTAFKTYSGIKGTSTAVGTRQYACPDTLSSGEYQWTISAFTKKGTALGSSTAASFIVSTRTLPDAPILIAPGDGAPIPNGAAPGLQTIVFSWYPVGGASRYIIEAQLDKHDGAGYKTVLNDYTTSTTYSLSHIYEPYWTLRWHVQALSPDTTVTPNSPFSAWNTCPIV